MFHPPIVRIGVDAFVLITFFFPTSVQPAIFYHSFFFDHESFQSLTYSFFEHCISRFPVEGLNVACIREPVRSGSNIAEFPIFRQ